MCVHIITGKARKNAYLVLQPSYSIESLVDHDQDIDASVTISNHFTSTSDNTEASGSHKTIPLSKSEDDFPLVEFSMSASFQKSTNKPSSPMFSQRHDTEDTVTKHGDALAGELHDLGSAPCKPMKTSISADNVKYFSVTPDINFVKTSSDNHVQLSTYKFEAKSSQCGYPRSISAHQGLKSSYQFGSNCNLLNTDSSTSTQSNDLCNENSSVGVHDTFKSTNGKSSSLKKSASHPVICSFADTQTHTGGNNNCTLQPKSIRRLKSSSVSPSKCTVNPSDKTKPKNKKTQFEFSQPVVVQPVTAYVLEVDSPQQYSDIEKDPECSEIYCVDEVPVDYLPSQDVRKQLFTDTDSEVFSHQKEVDDGSKDDELFGNPLKNSETSVNRKCSGLLEEISSDLAEKHR